MQGYALTAEEYQKLKNTDIRKVDPATVPDIKDVEVDTSLPPAERILDAVRQMNGNPFVFRSGGILVKTSFVGMRSLQAVLEDCLENSK